jgi:hypothetical protein
LVFGLSNLVLLGHDVFSPFQPCFSRGIKRGEWGLLARPRAAFLEGPKMMLFDFSEEPKAEGCRRGDKAEACRAANTQGVSLSRHARKKRRQKRSMTG